MRARTDISQRETPSGDYNPRKGIFKRKKSFGGKKGFPGCIGREISSLLDRFSHSLEILSGFCQDFCFKTQKNTANYKETRNFVGLGK